MGAQIAPKRKSRENDQVKEGMSKAEYVALGCERIMETLTSEYAVLHSELEARLAEKYHYQQVEVIQPHILTEALRELGAAGHITFSRSTTTNTAQVITTIEPSATHKIKTRVSKASASKRKLYGRYLSWNHATQRFPSGRLGPAGEQVLRNSLLDSQIVTPLTEGAGEVSTVLGHNLNGSLDSGGIYTPLKGGFPEPPVTVLIEVKNVRSWIYPSARELYQLLTKAVAVQRAAPDYAVLPVLICRRAHPKTFWMGGDLGFVVIDAQRQFVERVTEAHVSEIREALAFGDVIAVPDDYVSFRVRDRLKSILPKVSQTFPAKWKSTSETLHSEIRAVHRASDPTARNAAFNALGNAADTAGLLTHGWWNDGDGDD